MNADQNERPRHQAWLRIGLLFLAATTLNGSLWVLPFPRSFYEDFPLPGRDWVSTLGPYDEHLVRDYGALNLALGILLVATAIFLERPLTRVALVAWLGYAVPHFVFHTMPRTLLCAFRTGSPPTTALPYARTGRVPLRGLVAPGRALAARVPLRMGTWLPLLKVDEERCTLESIASATLRLPSES